LKFLTRKLIKQETLVSCWKSRQAKRQEQLPLCKSVKKSTNSQKMAANDTGN